MLFAFYWHSSISFVFVYLFIRSLFSHLFVYLFLPPPLYTSLLKIADWQSKARVFKKFLTRERLFNFLTNCYDEKKKIVYRLNLFTYHPLSVPVGFCRGSRVEDKC